MKEEFRNNLDNGTENKGENKLGGKMRDKVQRRLCAVKEGVNRFICQEDGMGTVEIVLIIIVLVGLVIVFKKQITTLVNNILSKMSSQANQI